MASRRAKRVLLLFCAVALPWTGAAGCGSCGSEPAPREREPLSLIPEGVLLVGSVDMDPVRGSAAYKRVLRNGNPMGPYLGDCTYDPLPDVDRVWFGASEEVEQGRGAVVVMGRVDRGKVLDCFRNELRRRGLRLEEVEVEGFTVQSAGPGRPHLAWVDAGTLVFGDRANVEKMLALEKGKGRSARHDARLMKLWERAAEGRDVAIAATPDESVSKRLASLVPEEWQPLVSAEQVAIGARFVKGMELMVTVRLRSGAEAERILGRLQRDLTAWQDHDYVVIAGLSSHLKAVRLEGAGPEITARATWTDKQLDTLARLTVDSIEEIARGGPDKAAQNLRERLQGPAPAKRPADGGPSDGGSADGGPGSTRPDSGRADR